MEGELNRLTCRIIAAGLALSLALAARAQLTNFTTEVRA